MGALGNRGCPRPEAGDMKWLRFYRRTRRDTEALREIEFHIEAETEENMASGMPAIEARRAAMRKFDNAALVREEIFQMNGPGLDMLWQDIRHAIRSLRRSSRLHGGGW